MEKQFTVKTYRSIVSKMKQPHKSTSSPISEDGSPINSQKWLVDQEKDFEAKNKKKYKTIHTKSFRDYAGNNALVYDIIHDDKKQLEDDLEKLKLDPTEKNKSGISAAEYALLFGSKLFPKLGVDQKDVYESIVSNFVDVKTDNIFTEERAYLITSQVNHEPEDFREFLARPLRPIDHEDYSYCNMNHVSKEQEQAIHEVYSEHKFHSDDEGEGNFGIYFEFVFCTLEKLLSKGFNISPYLRSSYVYDAKTLLFNISKDITSRGTNTKNMFYFNNNWHYGIIDKETVVMKTVTSRNTDDTIKEYLSNFIYDINGLRVNWMSNEVIIKWIVPVHCSYGLIAQIKNLTSHQSINMQCA